MMPIEQLQPGHTLTSRLTGGSFLVVRAGNSPADAECDGLPMLIGRPSPCGLASVAPDAAPFARPGVLYVDHATGLVLRCISAGATVPIIDGRRLVPGVWPRPEIAAGVPRAPEIASR